MQETAELDLDELASSPIVLSDVRAAKEADAQAERRSSDDSDEHDVDAVAEAERASEAALRRWLAE